MITYGIKIYGCKLNQSETDYLETFLDANFQRVSIEKADFVVINSCGIIDKTERKVIKKAKELKAQGKRVFVTGCLPSIIDGLEEYVDGTIEGNSIDQLKNMISQYYDVKGDVESTEVPTFQKDDSVSTIIPIATGCLGKCSYCSAKLARGKLTSFPKTDILEAIKSTLKKGAKEIQLTSQDLAVYGKDQKDLSLIQLLQDIISIDEDFKLKLGMMNPGFIQESIDELLDIYHDDKVYNFIHLPVQSGSNQILQRMKRQHTVEDFENLINKINTRFNDFLISTDIIVGFPGETEENFNKTVKLIEKTRPHIVNITRYSERSGTEAAQMKDMPSKIKKKRSRQLTTLTKNMRREDNMKWKDKTLDCLIFREGKQDSKLGRIFTGKAVVVHEGAIGDITTVKIKDFKHNYLIGEVV